MHVEKGYLKKINAFCGHVDLFSSQDHILRDNDEELRGEEHQFQVSDDPEVRHEDVVWIFGDHHLHVLGRGHHSRRPRLELGIRLAHHSLRDRLQGLR